jgi:hypothetical protein
MSKRVVKEEDEILASRHRLRSSGGITIREPKVEMKEEEDELGSQGYQHHYKPDFIKVEKIHVYLRAWVFNTHPNFYVYVHLQHGHRTLSARTNFLMLSTDAVRC